ncbi:hypothetical protein D2E25_0480 [Bifidobacterium goeldii]|uniref:Membrane associated protein n=1 Tax=Bifidobacterium goeldii TaxID=2306975 RepID=A0A430FMV9_9BIFI|nr:hypothetical protein [Bifidobacterium goeldii]RSX54172.1 hypothetical protein D2E25_0480 [Bifidobacterium goeldii]
MTENHNSNADSERPNPTPQDGQNSSTSGAGDDLDWAAFAAEHADDLDDVARSRNARRFERHAQRKEKEALLSVNDLDAGTFTDDVVPLHQRGPRDHVGSSWLDTDDVMDQYGDDFVPPNPKIGHVQASKLVFWILLLVGVAGIIGSVFVPALAAILGSVFGVCALIGAAGLILQHKGHSETRTNPFDDGARV